MAVQSGSPGEPLAPTMVVPLTPDAAGAVAYPQLSFDPTSRVLLVDSTFVPPRAWWEAHGADAGAGLAMAGAVLLAGLWRRAARRPQTAGKLYCRRCNYDLTPVEDARAPATCPECGPTAKGRPPASGRPVLRRLAAPMTLLVPAIAAGVWWVSTGVEVGSGGAGWPHPALRTMMPGWPLQRRPANTAALRVVRAHALTPAPDPVGREFRTDGWAGLLPTPDGAGLAWVEFTRSNGWRHELVVRAFDGSPGLRARLSTRTDGFPRLHGFTPDGRRAVVTITGSVAAATAPNVTVDLMTVDLTSGDVRRVGALITTASASGPGGWLVPGVSASVGAGDDPWWVITTLDGPAAGRKATGGRARPAAPAAAPTDVWILDESTRPATLSLNGALVASLDLSPPGATIGAPVGSPDGRWCAMALVTTGPRGSGEVRVWDMSEVRKRAGNGPH